MQTQPASQPRQPAKVIPLQPARNLRKQEQYRYFKEFRESYCDLFDARDFYYYAEMTGLKFSTIRRLANYSEGKLFYRTRHQRLQNYLNRI